MFRVNNLIAPNVDIWNSTLDQRFELGQRIEGMDATFGYGRFMYAKLASGTMAIGNVVTWDGSFAISQNPNTANRGEPVGVLKTKMDASAAVCYGWVQLAGIAPVISATVAATGAVYFAAAGSVTTTLTAGKQILNAKILQQPTYNFTRQIYTTAGLPQVRVADLSGMFIGMAVSGTGIPGGTTIAGLETGANNIVTLSANATALGAVTGTFTYTGYGQMMFDHPFTQGIVT